MSDLLIFEMSKSGRSSYQAPNMDVPAVDPGEVIPEEMLNQAPPPIPEVSELDLVRHFTHLSQKNYGVDTHFYPLGSCTMKYNPKVNERISCLYGFCQIHPYAHPDDVQGALELMVLLEKCLCEITGLSAFTLQPAAGAHGELTSLLMVKAYFNDRGEEGKKRTKIMIPDSAHGTNPASASICGFEIVELKSDPRGNVDLENLKKNLDDTVACVMLTMPNTLGLFDENMEEISRLTHEAGALLYLDGANLNAIMGITRPAQLGFDLMHLNLHKTFSTPHGGGGPGSGPVGVKKELEKYLPGPRPIFKDSRYTFITPQRTIGRVKAFYGNFLVMVKALVYIFALGKSEIRNSAQLAVLNANYLREKLKGTYHLPYDRPCLHEFVLSATRQKEEGASARDVGKMLLDAGFYAPTTYFPLIVPEALMIEPTETESIDTLDRFVEAMKEIDRQISENPEKAKNAPHTTPVKRVDEVKAARHPVLRWTENGGQGA